MMLASQTFASVFAACRDAHLDAFRGLADHFVALERSARLLSEALAGGQRILLCGNGGSAADAQHIAAELVGRFVRERDALPAIALTTDTSALTAIGNDYGFDQVFARQLAALCVPGDVLVAISTSGNSPNVLAAVEAAHARGVRVVGLLGRDGGRLASRCDVSVVVPSTVTASIQECHIFIGHLWCAWLDDVIDTARTAAPRGGVLDADALPVWRDALRRRGKRLVMTNGCFDLLHPGHLAYLADARARGDALLVAVNDDESVRRLKGASRPVNGLAARLQMLAALRCVDAVVAFSEDTPERLIASVLPELLVKGGDYRPDEIAGARQVIAAGGEVAVLSFVDGHSSSSMIERIRTSGKTDETQGH